MVPVVTQQDNPGCVASVHARMAAPWFCMMYFMALQYCMVLTAVAETVPTACSSEAPQRIYTPKPEPDSSS